MRVKLSLAIVAALLSGVCFGLGPPDDPPGTSPTPRGEVAKARTEKTSDRPKDEAAIRALGEAFKRAFDKGDARAIADLFADDAEIADETGEAIRGREAIAARFAGTFEADPGATIELTVESLRFLGPEVAKETGRALTLSRDGVREVTRYVVIHVRRDGRWLHADIIEQPDKTPTPHERLKELEWMLGEWVDESDDAVMHSTGRWSADENFLIREFTMRIAGRPFMNGTQRIGWDPLTNQFKSWVFDSEGGNIEGFWSRDDKGRWVVKARGVLADGRAVSATQIITFVNKDTARWQSLDCSIGGIALPDAPEIVLVREPPKPAAPTPSSPSTPPDTSRKR